MRLGSGRIRPSSQRVTSSRFQRTGDSVAFQTEAPGLSDEENEELLHNVSQLGAVGIILIMQERSNGELLDANVANALAEWYVDNLDGIVDVKEGSRSLVREAVREALEDSRELSAGWLQALHQSHDDTGPL